jgi:hypothetical protein
VDLLVFAGRVPRHAHSERGNKPPKSVFHYGDYNYRNSFR